MNEPNNDAGNDPYAAPKSDFSLDSPEARAEQTYEPKIFSMHGRLGRMRYFVYPTLASLAYIMVVGTIVAIFAALTGIGADKSTGAMIALVFLLVLLYIPLIGIMFVFAKRRLNDLNQTGWLGLLLIVPFLGGLFALYLLFAPGSKGTNQYGPAPSENPMWIKVLTGIVIVFAIIAVTVAIPEYSKMADEIKAKSEARLPANSTSPDKADDLPKEVKDLPAEPAPAAPAVGGDAPTSPDINGGNGGGGSPVEPTPQPRE
jgi:uncharacterized membrane protein YhaH (DUF805 family)